MAFWKKIQTGKYLLKAYFGGRLVTIASVDKLELQKLNSRRNKYRKEEK